MIMIQGAAQFVAAFLGTVAFSVLFSAGSVFSVFSEGKSQLPIWSSSEPSFGFNSFLNFPIVFLSLSNIVLLF